VLYKDIKNMIVDFGKKRNDFGDDEIVKTLSRESLVKYYDDIKKYQPLTRETEKELFLKLSESDDEIEIANIKDKIIKHNLLFVVSVARTYMKKLKNPEFGVEDLISEGNHGLYEAIDKFNINNDIKFISYAIWHIRKRIFLFLNSNLHISNVPSNIKQKIKIVNEVKTSLDNEFCADIDYDNIINQADIGSDKVKRNVLLSLKSQAAFKISITEEIHDLIGVESFETEQDETEGNEILKKAVYSLHPVNRVIVSHYFGLFGYEKLTVKKISEKYSFSIKRISDIIKLSIKELKNNSDVTDFFMHS
jgi:RNA polymerase primary sigma factor